MRAVYLLLLISTLLALPAQLLAETSFPNTTANANKSPPVDNNNGFTQSNEFLPVEQAYLLTAEFDSSSQLRVYWEVAEGYYLYRHGFQFQLMDGDQVLETEVIIPAGLETEDEYFGRVEVYYHNADLSIKNIPASNHLTLTITSQGCADAGLCYPPYSQYFQLDSRQLTVTEVDKAAIIKTTKPVTLSNSAQANSLFYMLLLAIMGGAILNLMPCVFPVLSLKVLAFANDKDRSQVMHGLFYSAGVVVSFVIVAALLVSLQAAGEAVGWGFHLQSPWFVAALAYLFFVMGLSLSGFIEFGGQMMNIGGSLAQKSGYSGSFFTGVLATIVASPCTAPFMGTALGYAVTQPTAIALLVFAALGIGMALPVLALSCSPTLLNKIPKPGPWMEQLKQLLAFPLYVTAVWLSWIVGRQAGVNGMGLLLLGCVLITFALWLWSEQTWKRTLSACCAAIAIGILTSPLMQPTTNNQHNDQSWQTYSPQVLSDLRQQGKPVFLNITADWCLTCLANEKVTLSSTAVKQALVNTGITYLKGDWTNHDPVITDLLAQYGRSGIPLYVIYPAVVDQPGEVLPQILTQDIVLEAIALATNQALR
jgi:thiol:disulfide interchange protein DsbD